MAVQIGKWPTNSMGMTIDKVLDMEHCVRPSGRACYNFIVRHEPVTVSNYSVYQLDGVGWAEECPEDCSDRLGTSWIEHEIGGIVKKPKSVLDIQAKAHVDHIQL